MKSHLVNMKTLLYLHLIISKCKFKIIFLMKGKKMSENNDLFTLL
jgi:hypothetical protein